MRIKACEAQIERNNRQLDNLRNITDVNFVNAQREKLRKDISRLEDEIQEHRNNPLDKDPESLKKNTEPKKKRKVIKTLSPPPGFEKRVQEQRHTGAPGPVSETTLDNFYKKLLDIEATLPEYIVRNLKNLPNNRGYIWRNVYYYGEREADSNVVYMTEPKKGFVFLHEIYPDEYLILKKYGRNAPELIERRTRGLKKH